MAMANIDGNINLYDGNLGLYMPGTVYVPESVNFTYTAPSSEYIRYNTAGQHQPGPKYFDGNRALYEYADGRHPQRPFNDLTTNIGTGTVLWKNLTTLGTWPPEPANIFVYKNELDEVVLVDVFTHAGAQESYMLCFNTDKYRVDARYNLRWTTKFLNANIPNRNAIPLTTDFKEPQDQSLETLTLEKLHMLRGFKQLYRLNDRTYTLDGSEHLSFSLASPYIYEIIYELASGKPYLGKLPDLIFYDPNAAYDTYGTNADIPFTNNFNSIPLRRLETSLKGPINIQGEYYWVTLLFNRNIDNITGDFTITSYKPTNLRDLPSRQLLVGIEHNKNTVITSAS